VETKYVFPVRLKLNWDILFRINSVFEWLKTGILSYNDTNLWLQGNHNYAA
jgi:hypothetical protein